MAASAATNDSRSLFIEVLSRRARGPATGACPAQRQEYAQVGRDLSRQVKAPRVGTGWTSGAGRGTLRGQPLLPGGGGMILVVGATGQLGSLVVRTLREQGRPVRALVRSPDRAGPVSGIGAELVPGDLRDPTSLAAALDGVEAVVATANSIAPSHREDSPGALAVGYTELISRAADAGVRRFVLASVP